MNRTAMRHTLSAFAALVLVSALATGPALCQPSPPDSASSFKIFTLSDPLSGEAAEAQKHTGEQNAEAGTPLGKSDQDNQKRS